MRWKRFDKNKPKTYPRKNGWYQCTVEVDGQQRYVMDLYWYVDARKFKDNRRQDVFNTYEVMITKFDDGIGEYSERVYTADICDRTDSVVAWRKMPKPYMKGFVKKPDDRFWYDEEDDDDGEEDL